MMKKTVQPFRGSRFSAFWRAAVLTALGIVLIGIGYFTAAFFGGGY